MGEMIAPTMEQRMKARNRPEEKAWLRMRWENLLFLHWEVDPHLIQETLPPQLRVDTFNGRAYLAVTPFNIRNTRPTFLPAIPAISDFYELNVRTYVYDQAGTPGVWFYSLDCSQPLAVRAARAAYSLPYFDAVMRTEPIPASREGVRYYCQRAGTTEESRYDYSVGDPLGQAAPNTFNFFAIERYFLFSRGSDGTVYSARVWHQAYSLFEAHLIRADDAMLRLNGFPAFPDPPKHAVFADAVDVDVLAPHALPSQKSYRAQV